MGKIGLFSISLIFFTFARRTKKITFFFVKNTTKSCNIFLHFHFLELKSTFPIFRFLHSISTPKNEKMNKKSVKNLLFFTIFVKNSLFFTIFECSYKGKKYTYLFLPLYEHSKIVKNNEFLIKIVKNNEFLTLFLFIFSIFWGWNWM